MSPVDALQRLAAEQQRGRLILIGAGASLAWLVLVAIFAALAPDGGGAGGWLLWSLGLVLPLALIWLAVWSARSLSALREEAGELRALLEEMQGQPGEQVAAAAAAPSEPRGGGGSAPRPAPAAPRPAPAARPAGDVRQASLALDSEPATQLTMPELFLALNFPDGPEDREAIRSLRLALADPGLARLIRAAQDVVTLLAGQGVYMDELRIPETDPMLWRRFSEGARGDEMAEFVDEDARAEEQEHREDIEDGHHARAFPEEEDIQNGIFNIRYSISEIQCSRKQPGRRRRGSRPCHAGCAAASAAWRPYLA